MRRFQLKSTTVVGYTASPSDTLRGRKRISHVGFSSNVSSCSHPLRCWLVRRRHDHRKPSVMRASFSRWSFFRSFFLLSFSFLDSFLSPSAWPLPFSLFFLLPLRTLHLSFRAFGRLLVGLRRGKSPLIERNNNALFFSSCRYLSLSSCLFHSFARALALSRSLFLGARKRHARSPTPANHREGTAKRLKEVKKRKVSDGAQRALRCQYRKQKRKRPAGQETFKPAFSCLLLRLKRCHLAIFPFFRSLLNIA